MAGDGADRLREVVEGGVLLRCPENGEDE